MGFQPVSWYRLSDRFEPSQVVVDFPGPRGDLSVQAGSLFYMVAPDRAGARPYQRGASALLVCERLRDNFVNWPETPDSFVAAG
jgi:hypothetical protein